MIGDGDKTILINKSLLYTLLWLCQHVNSFVSYLLHKVINQTKQFYKSNLTQFRCHFYFHYMKTCQNPFEKPINYFMFRVHCVLMCGLTPAKERRQAPAKGVRPRRHEDEEGSFP